MRLLEEFWFGNIEPTEYDTSSCKEYKKLLELICKNEEKLLANMTDEQKELFSRYTDCVREFQTMTDCLLFQNSFKLGARMMLEVMEELLNSPKEELMLKRIGSFLALVELSVPIIPYILKNSRFCDLITFRA